MPVTPTLRRLKQEDHRKSGLHSELKAQPALQNEAMSQKNKNKNPYLFKNHVQSTHCGWHLAGADRVAET